MTEAGKLSAEPVERHVSRWLCPFCNRGRSKRPAILAHMPGCYRNPAAKRCGTCEHLCPAEREEYDYSIGAMTFPGSPEFCVEGVQWEDGVKPRDCPKWSPLAAPSPPEPKP
jgi:hypothetical protein